MQKRNESLDALRGFAILTMVLSGSIAYGDVMPAWMYHAQVPPPHHKFMPTLAGITWVDVVFPFFLFTMGGKKHEPEAINARANLNVTIPQFKANIKILTTEDHWDEASRK